ncbi:MAG TPA: hypothetical protein VHY10_07905 [Xanthobacteraceae bacterium]|nr:hypothetical protein [Xanthobacteraceae bacterium]
MTTLAAAAVLAALAGPVLAALLLTRLILAALLLARLVLAALLRIALVLLAAALRILLLVRHGVSLRDVEGLEST